MTTLARAVLNELRTDLILLTGWIPAVGPQVHVSLEEVEGGVDGLLFHAEEAPILDERVGTAAWRLQKSCRLQAHKLFNVGFFCSFKLLLMGFSFGFSLFHSFFSSFSSSGCLFLSNLNLFLGSFLSSNSFLFSFLSHLFSKLVGSFSFFKISLLIGNLLSLFLSLSDKFLSSFSSLFSFFNVFLRFC